MVCGKRSPFLFPAIKKGLWLIKKNKKVPAKASNPKTNKSLKILTSTKPTNNSRTTNRGFNHGDNISQLWFKHTAHSQQKNIHETALTTISVSFFFLPLNTMDTDKQHKPVKAFGTTDRNQTIRIGELGEHPNFARVLKLKPYTRFKPESNEQTNTKIKISTKNKK